MGTWLKVLTWTAIVALPGGLLLMPVVVADHLQRRRRASAERASSAEA